MPAEMIKLAEDNRVGIEYWNFEPPVEAIYYSVPGKRSIIGLSYTLLRNSAHLRTVFAEELGHHFTTVGQNVLKTFFHYTDKLLYSKEEYRAMKWAANYLMPETKIEHAIKKGLTETWQLKDYFCVDEEIVTFRLRMLKKERRI
jgi:hypothetical protein